MLGTRRALVRSALDPSTVALISRMTAPPNGERRALIDRTVRRLKAVGVWDKLDALYVTAAADSQAAKLNWIVPRVDLTEVNGPAFVADRGYTGDGATSYLASDTNMDVIPGQKFSQNDASLFVWPITNLAVGGADAGSSSSLSPFIGARDASNRIQARGNSGTTTSVTGVTDSRGLVGWDRSSSTGYTIYKNGGSVATPATVSTVGPPGSAFTMCRSSTAFVTRQEAVGGFGKSLLGDANWLAFNDALNSYLSAVGAV